MFEASQQSARAEEALNRRAAERHPHARGGPSAAGNLETAGAGRGAGAGDSANARALRSGLTRGLAVLFGTLWPHGLRRRPELQGTRRSRRREVRSAPR